MAEPKEISKEIKLNLSSVPSDQHDTVKREVGEFVVNEILLATSTGKSPVKGETFSILDKVYADKEKGGNRVPNLRLDGDLMQDLDYEDGGSDIVKVGHFGGSEMGKADGHNKWNLSNNNKIPKRRYIPKKSQQFNDRIQTGIKLIIAENSVAESPIDFRSAVPGRPRTGDTIRETTQVQLNDVLSTDGFDSFLEDFFNG